MAGGNQTAEQGRLALDGLAMGLRALGLVSPEMNEFVVRLGDIAQSVGLKTRRFPNGGSWSFFVAPCCGRLARGGCLMVV